MLRSLDDAANAGLLKEPTKTKSSLISFPTCELACSLSCLRSLRLPFRKQLTTVIAATTTNIAAAETAANIYHGVLLDTVSVTEKKNSFISRQIEKVVVVLSIISSVLPEFLHSGEY